MRQERSQRWTHLLKFLYKGGLIKKSNRDVVGSDTLTARAGQEI